MTFHAAVAFTNGTLEVYIYDSKQKEIKLYKEIQQAHSSPINDVAFALVEDRYEKEGRERGKYRKHRSHYTNSCILICFLASISCHVPKTLQLKCGT